MPLPFATNPVLKSLPVYQPGRPIEEVARELGMPPEDIIKLASNENPLGPSPLALAAIEAACQQLCLRRLDQPLAFFSTFPLEKTHTQNAGYGDDEHRDNKLSGRRFFSRRAR